MLDEPRLTQYIDAQAAGDSNVAQAVAAFEAIGQQDPRSVVVGGVTYPRQLAEARLLLDFVLRMTPQPSLPLYLACHCQHLGRFESRRDEFPIDRAGYKAWRSEASRRSAERASFILAALGFNSSTIETVGCIVTKQERATNPSVQTMEDALCLAFLVLDAPEFSARHSEEEMIRILRRSWVKMSDVGRQLALETPMTPEIQRLVEKALEPQVGD